MPSGALKATSTMAFLTPPRMLEPVQRRVMAGLRRTRPAGAPQAQWQLQGESDGEKQAVLRLSGSWRQVRLPRASVQPKAQAVVVDGAGLTDWDPRLPAWLWPTLEAACRQGATVSLQSLPPALQASLDVALAQVAQRPPGAEPTSPAAADPGWVGRLGQSAALAWQDRRRTLAFIGQVVLAAVATLGRSVQPGLRSSMRASDVAFQFEQVGPRSLGIVALVSALVGLILAYMSGAQLQLFGAQSYVAPLLSIGEVREIAALVVGIVLAGRVAASFAAQLATMRASEEIDALRALGVDPVDFLVLPRLAALLLAAPLLTVLGAASGVLAGGLVALGVYDVSAQEYLSRSLEPLTLTHVLVGLFKGLLYGALVGLAGCRQGLHAERSAQGVGLATTAAVVQAIVWVAAAAAATTVIFHQLDW